MPDSGSIDAVLTIDEAGHYVDANDAALDLLGVTLSELRAGGIDVTPAVSVVVGANDLLGLCLAHLTATSSVGNWSAWARM